MGPFLIEIRSIRAIWSMENCCFCSLSSRSFVHSPVVQLSPVHTGDYSRWIRRLSPKTATVAEFGDKLSPFPATTVAEFGDYSRQCGQGFSFVATVGLCIALPYDVRPIRSTVDLYQILSQQSIRHMTKFSVVDHRTDVSDAWTIRSPLFASPVHKKQIGSGEWTASRRIVRRHVIRV